jgi:hypothetical protein
MRQLKLPIFQSHYYTYHEFGKLQNLQTIENLSF